MRLLDEKPTIRLHNVGRNQLSLSLVTLRAKAAPRLRRGVAQTPVRIPVGQMYDICAQLHVSVEEARRIVANSPEVKAHERARRLVVRTFPLPVEDAIKIAAEDATRREAQAKTDALQKPDPANALPAGVDPVELGLPSTTPRMTQAPGAPNSDVPITKTPEAGAQVEADAEADASDALSSDDENSGNNDGASDTAVFDDTNKAEEEPSMDWDTDRLKAYAAKHKISLGTRPSKTAMLKRIRHALSNR